MHPRYRRFEGWGWSRKDERQPRYLDVAPDADPGGTQVTIVSHAETGMGHMVLPDLQARLLGLHLLRQLADDLAAVLPLAALRSTTDAQKAALRRLWSLASTGGTPAGDMAALRAEEDKADDHE